MGALLYYLRATACSKRLLNAMAEVSRAHGYQQLVQGKGGTRSVLLEQFRTDQSLCTDGYR